MHLQEARAVIDEDKREVPFRLIQSGFQRVPDVGRRLVGRYQHEMIGVIFPASQWIMQ